jgi:nicotinamidase/pyrazinamidase
MTLTGSSTPDAGDLRVGWVVDVQNDFMRPTGRLYVHDLFDASDLGARFAIPAIERAVRWMRAHCQVVVFTGDWHGYGDREIDPKSPNVRAGTYPPHCMGLSDDEDERRGATLIEEVDPGEDALVLPRDAMSDAARDIARRAVSERRPVFVQKSEFGVFDGNRAADAFVQRLGEELGGAPEFVVCGVATDVCVKGAVEGLLDRGHRVRVISDAMWGLGLLGADQTFDLWKRRGATISRVGALSPND